MVIDLVLIAILGFSAFLGYKKGLAGILVSIIALLLSIILATCLQGTIANYLYKETTIGTTIQTTIQDKMIEQMQDKETSSKVESKSSFLMMFFDQEEFSDSMVEVGSKNMTLFILKGVSFIGIFVIIFIICYILRMILNLAFSLPILSSVNKIGGVGLNVLKTLFKIWVFLAVLSFVSFIPIFDSIHSSIESTILTKLLYENNLILVILKSTLPL